MFNLKYDGCMDAYPPAWHMSPQEVANVDFRLERLNGQTWADRLISRMVGAVGGPLLWLAQRLFPRLKIGRLLILTRDADVRAVLEDHEHFRVHYNPEMRELGGGNTFILALDGDVHGKRRCALEERMKCVDGQEAEAQSRARALQVATDLLAVCSGRIDVMKDYFCRVSAEAAIAYLGLAVDNVDSFADCTLAMSTMIFGDPFGKPEVRELASHAAWRLRSIADRSIALARLDQAGGMVQALVNSRQFNDGEIRAILLGLSTALVPTNTLAAGNMLLYLLRNRDAWRQAVAAARSDDATRLAAILLEAGRLKPALNPGQFRYMPVSASLPCGGRPYPANTVVLAATATALRDPRSYANPDRFQPGRHENNGDPFDGGLMFGYADHACLGKKLAISRITEMFRLLLAQPGLRRGTGATGAIEWVGPFPRRLDMVFDRGADAGQQAMVKIALNCPALGSVADSPEVRAARAAITELGNPLHSPELRKALDTLGTLHFTSLNLIDVGARELGRYLLLLEVNADGTAVAALKGFCNELSTELLAILARCGHVSCWDEPLEKRNLADFLLDHRLEIQSWPWGTTGLDYNGSNEFALPMMQQDAELAAFAARAVDLYEQLSRRGGKRAMAALQFVRALIRQDVRTWPQQRARALQDRPGLEAAFSDLENRGRSFQRALVMPSRHRLAFADWQDVGFWSKFWKMVGSPGLLRLVAFGLTLSVAFGVALGVGIGPFLTGPPWHRIGAFISWFLVSSLIGVLSLIGLILIIAGLLYALLRVSEIADRPDDRDPDFLEYQRVAALENAPGCAQNHFISVSDFKPGFFRQLVYAFALAGIGLYLRFWARPGFISDMGTIHFAGWLRPSGTGKLVFLANYDGSWESYLEDFVTRAHPGQTAVWSNALGFPNAENLVEGGASDGDRFKRWVRRQQRPSQFWYSRLPMLTLDRARTNALIHVGLARAGSDTEARPWLACFGSQPPMRDTVETDEVQSIVFDSLPSHPFAACLLISLPVAASKRQQFLNDLLGFTDSELPRLLFGDLPPGSRPAPKVAYLAVTPQGLQKCGLPGREDADGLASFAFPFVAGMASRQRVLGDAGDSAPDRWRWNDMMVTDHEGTVDAALWIVAEKEDGRDAAVEVVQQRLQELGGTVLRKMPTRPVHEGQFGSGHFGFSDGHSQPIIRGCNGARAALPRDLVQPGEFLFGYHNNQGCVPPTPRLRTELDPLNLLADTSFDRSQLYPLFQPQAQPPAFRDLGRNGSYLVLRELEQDVTGFEAANARHATCLKERYPGLEAAPGVPVSPEWVAAKLVGRWPDGTPLCNRVAPPTGRPAATASNDFSYADDDPNGFRCPLGAHIRRANPRDSLQLGNPDLLSATNRHRLIRRGRSYTYPATGETQEEKGLLFAAICGDLERQFEFVQQRWIAAPNFHGLAGEGDPLLAAPGEGTGVFTIPTVGGPVQLREVASHVTTRGGGYFFLPSRSTLAFLAQLDSAKRDQGSCPG